MSLVLSRPCTVPAAVRNWPPDSHPRAGALVSQVNFRRCAHPRLNFNLSMGRASSATIITASNGDPVHAITVEEEEIVEASEDFRARALVSSREQVRSYKSWIELPLHFIVLSCILCKEMVLFLHFEHSIVNWNMEALNNLTTNIFIIS